MNKKLSSLLDNQGSESLTIFDENFLEDEIIDQTIDSCFFDKVNFTDHLFQESDLVGVKFNFCSFQNCTFKNTEIRKSEFTDCIFKNCKFFECQISPRVNFFRTSFLNCQFSSIDFSLAFLYNCEFIEINLSKIKFEQTTIVDPKIKNFIFNQLEFNPDKPLRININKSSTLRNLTNESDN